MEFALVLRELLGRRRLVAAGVLVATLAAIFSVYRPDGFGLRPRSLQHSSASTQVLIDSPTSVLGNLSQPFEPLTARALVYANFMTSPVVLELIGARAGISGAQIYAAGPVNANLARVEQEPTALKRNVQITGETKPYRLDFSTNPSVPTINIYAQAPTTRQAIALADGAAVGLNQYVAALQAAANTPAAARVTIRQLGSANGSVTDGGISKAVAAIAFVAVFALWCLLVLAVARFGATWRASGELRGGWADVDATGVQSDFDPSHGRGRAWRDGEHADGIALVDERSDPGDGQVYVPKQAVR